MDLGWGIVAALDLLPEPILLVSVEGTIIAANRALHRQLRMADLGTGSRRLTECVVDPPEQLQEYLSRCARSGQFLLGTLHLRQPDGGTIRCWVEGAAFRASHSAPVAAVLLRMRNAPESGAPFLALNERIDRLNAEIGRRKLIETELRKERETLQVTLASIGDAVVVTDAHGCVTFLNPVAETLMGCRLDAVRGRPLSEVFHIINEATRKPVEDPIEKVFRTGFVVGLANHTVLVRSDGKILPIDDSAAPIRLGEEIIGAVLIFRDITSRRRAEAALQDANRRKDEFLAILAHELRNPLAPIRNAIEILAVSRQNPDRIADVQAIIDRQVRHMVRLIDDLMDVSRITQGRIELRHERVNLNLALQVATETSRPFLEARRQRLTVTSPDHVFVDADLTRLAQAFSNLLINSAKYSPPGTEVTVRVKCGREHVTIDVTDQGAGIPQDMLSEIFEMFVQVDRSPREGLGLGLTLVKRIIELHGGTVEALSQGEGAGSTFRVRLKAGEPIGPVVATAEFPRPLGTASRGRILVADDNRDAAQTLAMMLELDGHEVRLAYDGREALQVAEDFQPQVALLDIGMPIMDGYQTALRIRERPWGSSVILVALTGWGQPQDRESARMAGFDRHLIKPCDGSTVRALIDGALRRVGGGEGPNS